CMFCDREFENTRGKNDAVLHHLLVEHQLVIADVAQICDMRRYCEYWKGRLKEEPITNFCTVININSKPDIGPQVHYYLLCDALPEDRDLRERLQRVQLEDILECQQRERSDTSFSRTCLFCKQHFEGNRSQLLSHMAEDHGFNVGLPDNLVHINEFLDLLEEKLESLHCLYCEKVFKDRQILKDHMRKKQHKKINPKNKEYDKFYIINYLELGKTWEQIQNEGDEESETKNPAETEEWSDWTETPPLAVCLFCEYSTTAVAQLLQHLKDEHVFDILSIKNDLGLDFYGQVKIVNYIRKKVFELSCINCSEKFETRVAMLEHLKKYNHFALSGDRTTWDQPQYYFPTYENDVLLCCLDDDDDD
ncbi:predicted protein, partial [Nematostella vectensis]